MVRKVASDMINICSHNVSSRVSMRVIELESWCTGCTCIRRPLMCPLIVYGVYTLPSYVSSAWALSQARLFQLRDAEGLLCYMPCVISGARWPSNSQSRGITYKMRSIADKTEGRQDRRKKKVLRVIDQRKKITMLKKKKKKCKKLPIGRMYSINS